MCLGLCKISGSRSGVAGDGNRPRYEALWVGDTYRGLKTGIFVSGIGEVCISLECYATLCILQKCGITTSTLIICQFLLPNFKFCTKFGVNVNL